MRKRTGWILIVSGVVLLLKPSFDMDMMLLGLHDLIVNYWPAGFVFLGGLLLWPQKPPTSRKKRSSMKN